MSSARETTACVSCWFPSPFYQERKAVRQVTLNISEDFSEEERASALAKIAEAASRLGIRGEEKAVLSVCLVEID